jgi:Ig-like domain-containing protein
MDRSSGAPVARGNCCETGVASYEANYAPSFCCVGRCGVLDHAGLADAASTVAFLLRADVRRGTPGGQELPGDNELQSSLWQNNDITLFPGESQTLTVTWNSADLQGATAVVSVSGWNVPKTDILA